MNRFFQLMDVTTGNLVTEFDSEEDAIEALSEVQAADGDEPILEFALFRYQDGRPKLVAKESDLVLYVARHTGTDIHVIQDRTSSPNRDTTTSNLLGHEFQGAQVHREGNRWAFWVELEALAAPFGLGLTTATSVLEGGGRVAAT